MPQLIFKGVEIDKLRSIKNEIVEELSKISNTPKDYFTVEVVDSLFLQDEEMYPLIEIKQYKREKEIEKSMANIIANKIKSIGYKECEVYFIHIENENYYIF